MNFRGKSFDTDKHQFLKSINLEIVLVDEILETDIGNLINLLFK